MSPSLKNIPVSVPLSGARSSTCEAAANWPRKPNRVSTSCASGLLTTTCGSAAGGAPAELPLAPGEYLSHAPTNTIPAKPAAAHSLADVRPLIRRPLFSARSSEASSVPVSILLALLVYCSVNLHNPNQKKRSEEHTSELQSHLNLVCRLLLEKKKNWSDLRMYSDPPADTPHVGVTHY